MSTLAPSTLRENLRDNRRSRAPSNFAGNCGRDGARGTLYGCLIVKSYKDDNQNPYLLSSLRTYRVRYMYSPKYSLHYSIQIFLDFLGPSQLYWLKVTCYSDIHFY